MDCLDTSSKNEVANTQQNGSIVEFKRPLLRGCVQRKKSQPKILTEERYIEEMSKIIQRDFFPDLEKLRAQNEYLDAESRRDFLQMAEIRARYSLGNIGSTSAHSNNNRRNAMSPATFETPVATASCTNTPSRASVSSTPNSNASQQSSAEGGRNEPHSKLTLDAFLQHYTSEDNQSFQQIIEAAEAKLRQKYALLYDHEKLSAAQLQRALMLPSIEQQFETPDPLRKIETWTYTNMNSIMYVPNGIELSDKERVQAANCRPSIQYSATHLPASNSDSLVSDMPFADCTSNTSSAADVVGSEACINSLDLMPSPSPSVGESFSPLMTWGRINGTPFRLDGGDTPLRSTPGPSFRINENSRRENIAIALAEKASEKMRTQKQQARDTARHNIGSPFARCSRERLASMSPAAQLLATNKLRLNNSPLMLPSPTQRNSVIKAKHKQTPMVRKTPVQENRRPGQQTPSKQTTPVQQRSVTNDVDTGSTLTDDLLKIPTKRRTTAADFF